MNRTSTLVALGLALAVIAGAALYWRHRTPPDRVAAAPAASAAVVAAPASAAEPASAPAIRYPLPMPAAADAVPPAGIDALLADLLGRQTLRSMFQTQDFPRRFVATVDNLGAVHTAAALWPVNPTPGRFQVDERAGATVLGADNGMRYTPFVLMLENVDLPRAVAAYTQLYPQLQSAYEDLGYPRRHFNDRLVAVIDLLLATPEPTAPVRVVLPEIHGPVRPERPWVLYEFEDPAYRSLAAGQKLLLRMGPVNERRIKARLVELRKLVTAGAPAR